MAKKPRFAEIFSPKVGGFRENRCYLVRICRHFIHKSHGKCGDDEDKVNGYMRCNVLGFYIVTHKTLEPVSVTPLISVKS